MSGPEKRPPVLTTPAALRINSGKVDLSERPKSTSSERFQQCRQQRPDRSDSGAFSAIDGVADRVMARLSVEVS